MLEYNHDDHTVKLGSGLRLGHVLRELATNYNATLPTGICEWVGVGGHLQSSGLGPANKAVGLVMDLVKSPCSPFSTSNSFLRSLNSGLRLRMVRSQQSRKKATRMISTGQ